MPPNFALKAMNAGHRLLLKASGNRLGASVQGMPSLELTTVGRRSGRARPVMLTAPLVLGDTLVVVASRGGDDSHPAWYHNLRANRDVEVAVVGRPRRRMRARAADPGERALLWPRVTAAHPVYAGYQERTAREIPGAAGAVLARLPQ